MAHRTPGSVCETFTTTGTGSVTLAGAVAGHETFATAGLANTDTFIGRSEAVDASGIPTGDFEEAVYTWTTGAVITRTTIIKSSNSDAAVSWAAGTKRMYPIHPAASVGGADTSPAQLTANTNDWAVLGTELSVVRFSTDASRDITGLTVGWPGRIAYLHNIGSFNAVLKDESGSSTAANRFALTGDLTIYPDMCIPLQYDGTTARWRSLTPSSQTINDLTELNPADPAADFLLVYDASGALTMKVKPNNLGLSGGSFSWGKTIHAAQGFAFI
jgi:hypothetical protein